MNFRVTTMLLCAMVPLLFGFDCWAGSSGRYKVAVDPGSRYHFKYVQDKQTKKWVNRECELRVSEKRPLPKPLSDPESGDQLHVQLFTSISVGTSGAPPESFEIRDGYRVWRWGDVLHPDDLKGRTGYGVNVSWPDPGKETRVDPLEMFHLPPPGDTPPDQWSEWMMASGFREGAFGWLAEVEGQPQEPQQQPEFPFQLRCRLFLDDVPGVIR